MNAQPKQIEVSTSDIITENNRNGYLYNPDAVFHRPTVIQRSKILVTPNENFVQWDSPNRNSLEELISDCNEKDKMLSIVKTSFSKMSIIHCFPGEIVIQVKDEQGEMFNFYVETPYEGEDSVKLAFKGLCDLIGYPYRFAGKTDNSINKVVLDHWTHQLSSDKGDKQIIFLYYNDLHTLSVDSETDISAYNVLSIFYQPKIKSNEDQEIYDTVPFFGRILENVDKMVSETFPEAKLGLQSYITCYEGANKGSHFARLIFDNPNMGIKVGDEKYYFGFNISCQLFSSGKRENSVNLTPILFRQLCTNGMGITWGEEIVKDMEDRYVKYWTDKNVVANISNLEKTARAHFKKITSNGINIPIYEANLSADRGVAANIIEFFIQNISGITPMLDNFYKPFQVTNERKVVETFVKAGKEVGVGDNEVIKWLSVEFIAGNSDGGMQKIKTPMDAVNFITSMCKAKTSDIFQKVESKALEFGSFLYKELVEDTAPDIYGKYQDFKNAIVD